MTAKEKAKSLYEKYFYSLPSFSDEGELEHSLAKVHATITVDEMIKELEMLKFNYDINIQTVIDYYTEVLNEIKLICTP